MDSGEWPDRQKYCEGSSIQIQILIAQKSLQLLVEEFPKLFKKTLFTQDLTHIVQSMFYLQLYTQSLIPSLSLLCLLYRSHEQRCCIMHLIAIDTYTCLAYSCWVLIFALYWIGVRCLHWEIALQNDCECLRTFSSCPPFS